MQKKSAFVLLLQFSSTFIPFMSSRRPIQKLFAIVLLLVFVQKLGGGLYLHNWLHAKSESTIPLSPGKNIVSYSCNCIDDFSMPLTHPASEVFLNASESHQIFFSSSIQPHSFSFLLFNSLRAPPAIVG